MEIIFVSLVIFLVAGLVTGVAGFGFALLSTVTLTAFVNPSLAVSLVLPSFVAVNLSLLTNLNLDEIQSCVWRFYPYILSILVISVMAMLAVDSIPTEPLKIGLGVVSILFVMSQFNLIQSQITSRAKSGCFVESAKWMVVVGGISGFVFGASNIGVQMVAYLRSCELSERVFAGVLGLTFVGVNLVRFGVAFTVGLYPETQDLLLSVALAIPASIGVFIGKSVQDRISDKLVQYIVYVLLTMIGMWLILGGLNIV